ncbi:MAG: hypothetical protein M3409_12205 [Gemmatimonadota bacterium]|jgi:hypothetical protein|nr:hypothetical protein [Gemmatimonadota bacterium]
MALTLEDVVRAPLADEQVAECVAAAARIAPRIRDRGDLHARDPLERFIDVLLGETAERMVLEWLRAHGKRAEPASAKDGAGPDAGHDLLLRGGDRELRCSVKSSLSALLGLPRIVSEFTLATTRGELRHVNVQVYFWLDLAAGGGHRTTVPALRNAAIVGWAGLRDVQRFRRYATESRQSPDGFKLSDMRPMDQLLPLLR